MKKIRLRLDSKTAAPPKGGLGFNQIYFTHPQFSLNWKHVSIESFNSSLARFKQVVAHGQEIVIDK